MARRSTRSEGISGGLPDLAYRVRAVCQIRCGGDQTVMTTALGFPPRKLEHLFQGRVPRDPQVLLKVAKSLNVSHDWLSTGSREDAPDWGESLIREARLNDLSPINKPNEQYSAALRTMDSDGQVEVSLDDWLCEFSSRWVRFIQGGWRHPQKPKITSCIQGITATFQTVEYPILFLSTPEIPTLGKALGLENRAAGLNPREVAKRRRDLESMVSQSILKRMSADRIPKKLFEILSSYEKSAGSLPLHEDEALNLRLADIVASQNDEDQELIELVQAIQRGTPISPSLAERVIKAALIIDSTVKETEIVQRGCSLLKFLRSGCRDVPVSIELIIQVNQQIHRIEDVPSKTESDAFTDADDADILAFTHKGRVALVSTLWHTHSSVTSEVLERLQKEGRLNFLENGYVIFSDDADPPDTYR